jgi:hypothetical protein
MIYLKIQIVADGIKDAIRHMEALARMMNESPEANGWSTSDDCGSSMADWVKAGTPTAFPPNIQPFADGLAAHGFRLSRGTCTFYDESVPTWNIDRLLEQDFLPVFDCADQGDDEARIVALIGRAFAKWEAAQ